MRTIIGALILVAIVVHYFWWFVAIGAVVALVWALVKASEEGARSEARRRLHDDAVAARADQQDAWASEGDPRGMFGEYRPAC